MQAPQFYVTDYESIRAALFARFETITSRTLYPAQPEALVLEAAAYEIKVDREQRQYASTQMLISFSSAPALDLLVELIGVTRLAATEASTELSFTVAESHPGVIIPRDTRVASSDGLVIFRTDSDIVIPSGTFTGTSPATTTTLGDSGNGYAPGQITRLLDPRPYVAQVTNTTATAGGADAETDDELRERARLAPAQFSVAGPAQAYAFFAREVSPSIIDVSVTTPEAGQVSVYPLVAGGQVTPDETLALVLDRLNGDTIRPLTDTVTVLSPELIEVDIEIELTLYSGADAEAVQAEASQRVAAYMLERERTLGLDVKRAQIVALAVGDTRDVFDATVLAPVEDLTLTDAQVAKTRSFSLTVIAFNDG